MSLFLRQSVAATLVIAAVTSVGRSPGSPPAAEGLSIARAYLSGMNAGEIAALDRLFLPDGRSSILENASDEGSWEHYRDHHLKPEMEASKNFRFTAAKESEERFGDVILVRQTGSFTVEVNGEMRKYRAAVSYVIVTEGDRLCIAHLHWSSRPDQRTATRP